MPIRKAWRSWSICVRSKANELHGGPLPCPEILVRASNLKNVAAYGIGLRVTRHPRMGAVEEPEVTVGEHVWNEWSTDARRENAGVYTLLWVNVNGMRQLEANRPVLGSGA